MSEEDPVTQYLSRADHLAVALDVERALVEWDKNKGKASDQQVAMVFADPENMRFARVIVNQAKSIKKHLLLRFGFAMHSEIERRLSESEFSDQWELKLDYHKEWTKAYAGSGIRPKLGSDILMFPYLYAVIQRTNDFINFGISRSEKRTKRPDFWLLQEVTSLESFLEKRNFKKNPFWLGYEQPYDLREDEIYLAAAAGTHSLIMELVDGFWDLFKETRDMMEKANQTLAEYSGD